MKLGSCLSLAARGGSPGEREAAITAAQRVIAKLPQDQRDLIRYAMQQLSPTESGKPRRPPPKRRGNTRRQQILELLDQGLSVQTIALQLGIKPNYVYHVKAERKYGE